MILIIQSCNSQESKNIDISGNWIPIYLGDPSEQYTEFYIEDGRIYYYSDHLGEIDSNEFKILDSVLFLRKKDQEQFEKMGTLELTADTLYIHNSSGKNPFVRQRQDPTLDHLIRGIINEELFFESYVKRATIWNEKKYSN